MFLPTKTQLLRVNRMKASVLEGFVLREHENKKRIVLNSPFFAVLKEFHEEAERVQSRGALFAECLEKSTFDHCFSFSFPNDKKIVSINLFAL